MGGGDIEELGRSRSRRNSLSELPCGAQKTSLSKKSPVNADASIRTSIFDVYKIGPGPSSSHTIGPMKICNDFLKTVKDELVPTLPKDNAPEYVLLIHLHGSLSATGLGHGTHTAVIGGLLGWEPKTCDPFRLLGLLSSPDQEYDFPVPELGPIKLTAQNIVWHNPSHCQGLYHPNTLKLEILQKVTDRCPVPPEDIVESATELPGHVVIFEREYYSVGGGFIEKKGCLPEDFRTIEPRYPFSHFDDVLKHVQTQKVDLVEIVLRNEEVLTGKSREEIMAGVSEIVSVMDKSVERGLAATGTLPGPIQLKRKAKAVYETARKTPFNYLGFLNAYAMAASEENAAGMTVVTAPTSGSAGVLPGLLYFMKYHLRVDEDVRQKALVCACLIGFVVKHNASISGAEMGCMGEIGVASSMGAAMLAYALESSEDSYKFHKIIEAAAEIALEHHLGMTCDPIGGFVQIPCIQRNSMGAVKAYNAYMLAIASDPCDQKISLDNIILTMKRTGRDMNSNYKETSLGGLAALTLAQSEC